MSEDTEDAGNPADADVDRETDPETDRLVVYADYVCPFCHIGRSSLEDYLAEADDPPAVDWRPFDLRADRRRPDGSFDPEAPGAKSDEYFERAAENVRRLRDEYGVEMNRVLVRDVDSLPAHQAALGVRRELGEDAFGRFHDAVYRAMWVECEDVGDPEVLQSVAERADVDPDVVAAALEDEDLREAVREQFDRSRRAGVTGVPAFVYGQHAARGAVPPAHLRRLVEGP